MFFEISFAEKSTVLSHELVDPVRDLSLVEGVPTFFSNQTQRLCQCRVFENFAFRRRPTFAIDGIRFEKGARRVLVNFRRKVPVKGDQLGDWKSFVGVFRRRRQIVTQLELAEFLMQLAPGINASGHIDWKHAARWNRFAAQFFELRFHLVVVKI